MSRNRLRHAQRATDPLREFGGRDYGVMATQVSPDWRQRKGERSNTFDGADRYVIISGQCRVSTARVVFRE